MQTHFSHGFIAPITSLTHPRSAMISAPSAETAVMQAPIAPPTLVAHGMQVMTSGIKSGLLISYIA